MNFVDNKLMIKITVILRDDLVKEARRLTHIKDTSTLIHFSLERLIQEFAKKRLAALGGTQKNLRPIPRRRFF